MKARAARLPVSTSSARELPTAGGVPSPAPWEAYIRRDTRLTFALQYFLNSAALGHVRRYADCATALGAHWHLIVHEDDGEHVPEWQHKLASLGTNATQVVSQNVHELRGYNMAAHMRDADIVIYLQDDEEPPTRCDWLGRTLASFERDPKLGAVGLRRGATNGDWDDEVRRHGRTSLGVSELLQAPARYVLGRRRLGDFRRRVFLSALAQTETPSALPAGVEQQSVKCHLAAFS